MSVFEVEWACEDLFLCMGVRMHGRQVDMDNIWYLFLFLLYTLCWVVS